MAELFISACVSVVCRARVAAAHAKARWAARIGFPLYTVSMLAGFLWASFTWKKIISWDPKEIVSIIVWIVFALLFHQRMVLGWRGKKPAKTAIVLFLLCLASLVGVNFLLPTHHSFRS